jgi:mannan endo-1,4-beta-mannosidase
MKLSISVAAAVLACLTAALPTDSDLTERQSSALVPRASNAKVNGFLFDIDGTTKYWAGTNSYWISFLTNNADVDLVMSHLQSSGLKILRVWGFNDIKSSTSSVWFQSFISGQSPQINTGANGLQRLDYVVKSAESHGIKLIIPFVNYWDDYGGMAAYNAYYGITTKTQWYTDSRVQAQYQTYIKAVVDRYKSSTAIFAWELANEVRCPGCSTDVIYQWAQTTSAYVKSLDSSHMVTLGDEGFMDGGGDGSYPYTKAEGVDFKKNLAISTLDFGTFHLYPSSWGVSTDWGNAWVTNHAAACVAANKPCMLEEYGTFPHSFPSTIHHASQNTRTNSIGYPNNHIAIEGPWQTTSLNTNGMGADLFWQLGDNLSTGLTSDDTNTVYYGSADWTGLVTNHVAAINAKYGGSTPTTTAPPAATTTPPASTQPANAVPKWGQCGGQGYTGSSVCVAGSTCVFSNQWYSQCL